MEQSGETNRGRKNKKDEEFVVASICPPHDMTEVARNLQDLWLQD
jgi:hypothetical protein